jgi:hypothetical protein
MIASKMNKAGRKEHRVKAEAALLNAVVRTLDERREQAVKINWRESV